MLKKLADAFNTSTDFIANGTAEEKAQNILVDAELIKQFKEMETLPDTEKNTILKVVTAYIRDLKTKQAYIL